MRNVFVFLGILLAFLVIVFSVAHIVEASLFLLLAGAVLLIGIGVASWPQP